MANINDPKVRQVPTARWVEVHSADWIPESERHGKLWHQGPLWFLGNFNYFTVAIGFIGPSMGLSLWWTILAGAIGIFVGTFFMALHASQGPKLGLPQMIQSRAQFGYHGVIIVLFGSFFTYSAFNISNLVLLPDGMSSAFHLNALMVAIITAVVGTLIAIFGHDWIHAIFRWIAAPAAILVTALTVGILFGQASGNAPAGHHFGFTWVAFMAQFAASAAFNISYAPYVSDWSRYLPTSTKHRSAIIAVFSGAWTAPVWLIAVGAWLATELGATDGLAGVQAAGNNTLPYLGDAAGIALALTLLAVTGMNAYGAMLTVVTGIDSVRPIRPTRRLRVVTLIVLMLIWYFVARSLTGSAIDTVSTALTLMLYLLVPWTATNLVDYFIVRAGHYAITDIFRKDGIYGGWGWRGITAWVIGLAVEIPFMVLPKLGTWTYEGPAAKALSGIDISWLVGLAVTAVVYWILARSLDLADEEAHARETNQELVQTFSPPPYPTAQT